MAKKWPKIAKNYPLLYLFWKACDQANKMVKENQEKHPEKLPKINQNYQKI